LSQEPQRTQEMRAAGQPCRAKNGQGRRLTTCSGALRSSLAFSVRRLLLAGLLLTGLFVAALSSFPDAVLAQTQIAPEAATGFTRKSLATATRHMVATANPHASEAGLEILRAGGSAADAAVATQLVLNLVEPQSSGIGGGAFILHWDAQNAELSTFDGRETAPAAAKPDRFIKDGARMPFRQAVNSGLSVGVPGTLAAMELLHERHGRLPWARLFEPAIRLAESGFPVSPRLNLLLTWFGEDRFAPAARAYFFSESGSPHTVGHILKNPEFAKTLRILAAQGARAFYKDGPIARSIVAAVASAPNNPGDMTISDIGAYKALERAPVCVAYRQKRVCSMGPPSAGGYTVGQTLMLLEGFPIGGEAARMKPLALHLIAEAEKLAYADRGRYIADPAFVEIPAGLLASGYIAKRARLINPNEAMPRPAAGQLDDFKQPLPGIDATQERSGTSHFSIVDADGNAVSMTTTIESGFGSGLWASGFLLNNELTDFSFLAKDRDGLPINNRVEGGKRPRSSMSPTMVFDEAGRLEAVLGSVGGSRIILYVVKTLVALIDWKMNAQEAADLTNFGSRGGAFEVELSPAGLWEGLKVKPFGHTIMPDLMTSGTQIIVVRGPGQLEGSADPRREGTAVGD